MDDLEFQNSRSEWVLETSKSLAPMMNLIHSVSFTEVFWARLLIPYVWTVYNQKQFYEKKDFKAPVLFDNIKGWEPPNYKEIALHLVLDIGRSLQSPVLLSRLDNVVKPRKALVLGVRSDTIAKYINVQKIGINWLPLFFGKNKNTRKKLFAYSEIEKDCLRRNLIINLPKVYVEYFGSILVHVSKLEEKNIENVYFEHFDSFVERFVAAYLGECGATLNHLQTGGHVGEANKGILPHSRYRYDLHLTYGWKLHEKDVPFYAVRLEEFFSSYRAACNVARDIDLLLVYNNTNSKKSIKEHYDVCTRTFSEGINRDKYPNIVLRPRGISRRLSSKKDLSFLKKYFSSIDAGKVGMDKLCARSKVIVHWYYPTTNFLECIFVNHPVICLISNLDELTPLARKYIPHMERLGIFHENVKSIIDHLNSINVDSWWEEIMDDQWYQSYKNTFARSKASFDAKKLMR